MVYGPSGSFFKGGGLFTRTDSPKHGFGLRFLANDCVYDC